MKKARLKTRNMTLRNWKRADKKLDQLFKWGELKLNDLTRLDKNEIEYVDIF